MPSREPTLALVVPVFDEQDRLGDFAGELIDFIARRPPGSELVFVDDGSTDGTVAALEQILGRHHRPRARLLRRPHEGKGAAVASGIRSSTAHLTAFCDVDLSTPLPDLERIIEIASRADVLAIGSRDLSTSTLTRPQGAVREALGRAYNRLVQATVTPGVVDTQCGAKAARTEVWGRLLPHCRQRGFAWDAEVVAIALAIGIDVQEVAISWHHDGRTRVHLLSDGLAMVRETPRLMRSAASARTAADALAASVAAPISGRAATEVFDAANAARMRTADRTHWWFRSKAAFVATALRRTSPRSTSTSSPVAGWLVDAGGGSGGVSALLGWPIERVLVLEASAELVGTARERGLPAMRGSVNALPIPSGSAAVVTLLDVMEHLADPHVSLMEAARALEPGGRLVVNVPAHPRLWSGADVALGHHRRYRRRTLRAELRRAGFEPEVLTHVFSWLVAPVWLVRRRAGVTNAELGLDRRSPLIDLASLVLTAVERQLIGRLSLPVGTSILCVARRSSEDLVCGQPIQ